MSSIQTILVPTDFSASADAALEKALTLAEQLQARALVLHVYGIPPMPDAMGIGTGVDIVGPVERAAEQALEELSKRHRARPGWGGTLLRMGDPRDMIVQQAAQTGAGLIVMGTHGRRGFQHLLLGSVAEGVMRHARCPVLVVPSAKGEG